MNLYQAHKTARKGKRSTKEVIEFELDLAGSLSSLSDSLQQKTYSISGYYRFFVHEPKERLIHALHYKDRVVQHCLCDEVLGPLLDKKLIYDNAACRIGKGNHFALARVSGFLREYYNRHGAAGYVLKCDVRKFFDHISHDVLKAKLRRVIADDDVLSLLFMIIDSYETEPGRGLPLGNQTSQWFAIYYLDGFDRLIKENMRIKYYSRYMDDCVIIHEDKAYLQNGLVRLRTYLGEELKLEFNDKTQIFPLRQGVNYLGFHVFLTDSGKIVKRVRQSTKCKYRRRLKYMCTGYASGLMDYEDIQRVLANYHAHLSFGHTYRLRERALSRFVLKKQEIDSNPSTVMRL